MKWYGPTQFALFRIALGIYLTIHFVQLIPDSAEIFSNQGVIADASTLPSFGKVPNILFYFDDPLFVNIFLNSLILCCLMFTFGIYRRISAFYLFYGWMCLLNRNPLISNPSIGYIGWILLACSVIPKGERLGFLLTDEERNKENRCINNLCWEMPDIIYYGSWIIVGLTYTASGIHKLQCDTWIDGTALYYVLTSPIAYQNFIIKFVLSDVIYIKILSWGSLFLEISAVFLGTFYRTRKFYWLAFMGFHGGILATVNFVDLTFGMIMAHLFTFDASWYDFTKRFVEKYDYNGKTLKDNDINLTDQFNSKTVATIVSESVNSVATSIKGTNLSSIKETSTNIVSWIVYGGLVLIAGFIIKSKGGLFNFVNRISELTIDMYWGFGFLVTVMGFLMILERMFPDQELKYVPGWWKWVLLINIFQLFAVILAAFTWEDWLLNTSYFTSKTGFHLRDHVTPFWGGVIAYVFQQWLFYYWHKGRHELYICWILFHQFHHSPSRIETITSFYKHPLEIIIDSQIMAILLYSVLGLTNESSIWLSIFCAIGEYIYHMNIKTPWIMGFFFQRPEMHRLHHRHMHRRFCPNYVDLPIFDMLGGTFENPVTVNDPTGFTPDREIKRIEMLLFKDVITGVYQDVFSDYKKFKKTCIRYVWYILAIWGALNSAAFLVHTDMFREIGFVSASSPLPLVFSAFNGVETFATGFVINATFNNTSLYLPLDHKLYQKMGGSYNRRNVYGAIFTHAPFFDKYELIRIRQNILYYAVCDPGTLAKEFGFDDISRFHVDVLDRTTDLQIGQLNIFCD